MHNRANRAAIAQDTLAVLAAGSYQNRRGEAVDIGTALGAARTGSIHYTGAALAGLPAVALPKSRPATRITVVNESTLAAARRLIAAGHADPLCLNFASARNPGGGFLGGSEAQEENLAKSPGLYPCLERHMAMYEANRALDTCLYNDDMIYSPQVPVFRDDAYAYLDAPVQASIVSAPAVNRGAVTRNEPHRVDQVAPVTQGRIDKLLRLAVHHGHRVLVLGAWGCGVFGNRPEDMAAWFPAALRSPPYAHAFELVHFAVLDRRNDGTFAAFEQQFAPGR